MATRAIKCLGQEAPSATTNTDVYTVPSGKQAVVANLHFCNRSSSARTVRARVRKGGIAEADKQYLVYDVSIAGNDVLSLQMGISLTSADVISVYHSHNDVSVSAFGFEEDI